MSECDDIAIRELLFQSARTIKIPKCVDLVQPGPHHTIENIYYIILNRVLKCIRRGFEQLGLKSYTRVSQILRFYTISGIRPYATTLEHRAHIYKWLGQN